MTDARSNILQRLRQSIPPSTETLERPVERHDWPQPERLRRFIERMQAVRAEVHRTTSADWPALIARLAQAKGISNLLLAEETEQGAALALALRDGGVEPLAYAQPIETWKARLFEQVEAAFTSSHGAIADTGSLILWPDAHEPRLMSLVPPIHFVLLDAEQIYSTFAQAMSEQNWVDDMPTNALLISGPSKSADIAQVLAYGVHGPKELVVLIVE
jgi:L-lactate dehydrogenase complex protein LldG